MSAINLEGEAVLYSNQDISELYDELHEVLLGWKKWIEGNIQFTNYTDMNNLYAENVRAICYLVYSQLDTMCILSEKRKLFLATSVLRLLHEHIQAMYLLFVNGPDKDIHIDFSKSIDKPGTMSFYYQYITKKKLEKMVSVDMKEVGDKTGLRSSNKNLMETNVEIKKNLGIFIHPSKQAGLLMAMNYDYHENNQDHEMDEYHGIYKSIYEDGSIPAFNVQKVVCTSLLELSAISTHMMMRYNAVGDTLNPNILADLRMSHDGLVKRTFELSRKLSRMNKSEGE